MDAIPLPLVVVALVLHARIGDGEEVQTALAKRFVAAATEEKVALTAAAATVAAAAR